jgi:hypothetical protein
MFAFRTYAISLLSVLLAAGSAGCAVSSDESNAGVDEKTGTTHQAIYVASYGNPQLWHSAFCYSGQDCQIADVNGDGLSDIVAFTHDANPVVWVGLGQGNSFGTPQLWHSFFCTSSQTCALGDVDGDGKADLIAFARGTSPAVWVAKSTSSGAGTAQIWHSAFCLDGQVCKVGDVTGDGKADVVAFTHDSSPAVWVGASNGSTAFGTPQLWSSYFCTSTQECDVGSANLDGKADVFAFTRGASHQTWVSTSTGSGLNAPSLWSSSQCFDGDRCKPGVVNGTSGVVIFTAAATVFVSEFNGSSAFSAPYQASNYFCTSGQQCLTVPKTSILSEPGIAAITGTGPVWVAREAQRCINDPGCAIH